MNHAAQQERTIAASKIAESLKSPIKKICLPVHFSRDELRRIVAEQID
jgi:hypothetical protein